MPDGAGAGDGLRTRYLDLGKVALYQVSYSRSARPEDRFYPASPSGPAGDLPTIGQDQPANQAVCGSGHGAKWRPHRSRSAFARIADSCSFVRSKRPASTAAFTAAIDDTS